MKRRHPFSTREVLQLQPKSRRPGPTVSTEQNIISELQDPVILAILVFVLFTLTILLLRSLRRRSDSLPRIPWVHLERRRYFSKIRARTWTTVNYEAALKEAYVTVGNSSDLTVAADQDCSIQRTISPASCPLLTAIPSSCHRPLSNGLSTNQIRRSARTKARRMCYRRLTAFLFRKSWIVQFILVSY